MSFKLLPPIGFAVFLIALFAWLKGGVQPYYKTRYQITRFDPFTELEYTEWVEAFLPGGETVFVGFFVLVACVLAASILERRSSKR